MKNHFVSGRFRFLLLVLVISQLSFGASLRGKGGGADSGGGDVRNIADGTAWFLGTNPIRYCYDLAPGFGLSKTTVEETIERAFGTWQAYMADRGLNSDPQSVAEGFFITLHRQLLAHCDGSEDLKIYLGTLTPEVEKAKRQFEDPVSFAYRSTYDPFRGWGKGFLWFALPNTVLATSLPDWTKPNEFYGMLLHELGHVLGCPHVEGTIMDSTIAMGLMFDPPTVDLTHIDQQHEVALCKKGCTHVYAGRVGHRNDEYPGAPAEGPAIFKTFMNRAPVGKVRAEVTSYDGERYVVSLIDDTGRADFPVRWAYDWTTFGSGLRSFSMFLESLPTTGGMSIGIFGYPPGEGIRIGSLHSISGRDYSMTLELNSNNSGSPIHIDYYDQGKRTTLFETLWPGQTE